MKTSRATILQEYGPYDGVEAVHGVTFDGTHVWFAAGDRVHAMDPGDGAIVRSLDAVAPAGAAFDGTYLYLIAGRDIHRVDPASGAVLKTIPAPVAEGCSGMAWAEGCLWVGAYRDRRIHQVDPETGAVLRTIRSERFVTGVTWAGDELWHGTWEGDSSDLRRVDPASGEVLERVEMPAGTVVSGLESDGAEVFYCGGGPAGRLRAVRRPRRAKTAR
jgi:outer membrane protein assembly factor BamB